MNNEQTLRLQKALSIAAIATGVLGVSYLLFTRYSKSSTSLSSTPSSPSNRPNLSSAASADFDLAVIFMRERVSSSKSQVQTAFGSLTIHEKLRLYGLYKQGSIRDGNDDGFNVAGATSLDPIASAKYAAWKAARSLSPAEARTLYVELINKLFPSWKNDLINDENRRIKPESKKSEAAINDTNIVRSETSTLDKVRKEDEAKDNEEDEEDDEEEEERDSHRDGMRRGYSSVPVYEEPPIGDRGVTDIFYIVSVGNVDAARTLLLKSDSNSILSMRNNGNELNNNDKVKYQTTSTDMIMSKNNVNDGDKGSLSIRCKILSQVNEFGESLFHIAADAGHLLMCELLINECIAAGGKEFVKRVLDVQEPGGQQSALHYACSQDRIDICKLLIKMGVDVKIRDVNGREAVDLIENEVIRDDVLDYLSI